jgi:hypothetical protein
MCSGRECTNSGTCCVTLATNPVKRYEWGTDRSVITTNGKYTWSFNLCSLLLEIRCMEINMRESAFSILLYVCIVPSSTYHSWSRVDYSPIITRWSTGRSTFIVMWSFKTLSPDDCLYCQTNHSLLMYLS